jgi:hypothetical protein
MTGAGRQALLQPGVLLPPDFTGTVNIGDVAAASGDEDHIRRVRQWGESVYGRWRSLHHAQIVRMVQRLFQ